MLADFHQLPVSGRGDRIPAEPMDVDSVQTAGAGDDESVTPEPDLDGEPGRPVIEITVDECVRD